MKMKSLFMTILFTGMLLCTRAQDPVYPPASAAPQNITEAEYFVDTDPGIGAAANISVTAALNISNAPALINVNGLSTGVHKLVIRSRNNQGVWGISSIREFLYDFDPVYIGAAPAPQNIVAAEYFIDTDPGFGSATSIPFTLGVNINDAPATVNTSALSNGVHRLYIRTKNNEGRWSLCSMKDFIVDFNFAYPASPATPQNIVAAEYFINTDPGAGNGTTIPVTAALDINNISAAVNTSGLAPATTNWLFLRTKNNEGQWSIANSKVFVVDITNDPVYPPAPVAAQNIVAAEYFINTDPGAGNGTTIPVTAALDINNMAAAVNTSGLAPATTNWLFLRTKNNEGRWSIANVKQFTVDITNDPVYPPAPIAAQNVVAAEYFINTDPGVGNGTNIPVSAALDISNVAVIVNTASLTAATTNHLFLRTKNNEGRWSITSVKQFSVDITNDPVYPPAPVAAQNAVAAEYFIDTDPGHGSGTTINLTAATDIPNIAATVAVNGLSNGQHRLFIRSKNNEGKWSISNVASFYTDLLSLSADSLLFGNVPINTTISKNLIITNNSNVSQTINAVTIAAPYSSNFTGVRTIPAGAKDTILVDFTPTIAGLYIQGIQLQTSAGNYSAGLRGTGVTQVPSWTISPASGYNYGNIPLGTPFNGAFNIQNTGNVPVTLSNVSTTDAAFVASYTPGAVIPVNGNLNIFVMFTPTLVQPYSGLLKIESSTAGVGFVTTVLSGNGYNPGAPPVLQFVPGTPYNAATGVNPAAGQVGDFTYKILYKSANNRAPQTGSPRVAIDLNGDQDFTDLNEGIYAMIKETAGTDYVNGIVYAYTYTHLNNTSTAGYKFSATDDNGNAATTINTNYVSGPIITNQQLDLRIFANDITFSKNNPLPNETFTVFAKVSNSTALPATNIPVKFYRDTILIGSDIIPAVNAFSNATISRTLSFAAEGFYPIKVWIDSSNTLTDINPLNNYAIRPVIVGSPNLPGGIVVTTTASAQQCPQVKVLISGYANYYGTGSASVVAGAEVTINTGTQLITTTTNSGGYYSYLLTGVTCGSNFTYNVSVTDFTFTSSLVTNSIPLPCPPANACVPAPSMGGAFAIASSNPCANIAGSNTTVTMRLQYRQRNLANFWNGFDQIIKDTLKIFQDGVLIQTIPSADYSNGPGAEVNFPVFIPLASTTATVISAELKYTYIEYLQIPSSLYAGNFHPMLHTTSVTINPVASQPDLTIQNFVQTSFTSFSFNDANIKCVPAGAHVVKVFDSIPGGSLTLIDTRNISSLGAGATTAINYSDPAISSGLHFIRVITDFDGTVSETNEANNVFTFTIVVPPSELTVTKLTTSPTNLNIGSTTRFTATVNNTGRRAGSFTVRFEAAGVQLGALKTVTFLNENSSVDVISDSYTVTNASSSCGVLVRATADFGATITESNELNNDRAITLGVDLAPYQLSSEVGSPSNPAVVRVFTTNQFYPAVRNIGNRDAHDVTIRFELNGNWIGADTVGYIKAGEIFAGRASFTQIFTVAGNYVVRVTADTSNTICENSEANNQGDFHIRVVDSKPDLEVLSQYISPSSLNPNIGQTITLVGTVKNMGGNVTTASVLRFLVDNIQLGADIPINALLPGRDTTVAATANYSSIIPGVKVMRLIADPLNVIVEEREDNNEATRAMIVGDAPDFGRFVAGAIGFNPGGFGVDDSVDVKFTLKNFGPQPGGAWVKFLITDTLFNVLEADSVQFNLNDGDSVTLQRRMLFTTNEGYVTTQILNSNPIEFDLLNNFDTLRFTTIAKLQNAVSINGNLDMSAAAPEELHGWIGGKIVLGDFDLTVNGVILNFDTTRFVVTNGTGKLKLVNNLPENIYPVGTDINNFNFVQLNNSGTADNFSVRVRDFTLRNGNSGDTVFNANVDRTWFIEETVPGGSNATATFFWSTSDELPGFDRTVCRTAHYTNVWELGSIGNATLLANGQYSKTQAGFTNFSPFTVTSGNGTALPVRLISFNAISRSKDVLLQWQTSNEINASKFEVERSRDANSFSSIGTLPANNTPGNHNYQLVDVFPLNGNGFYRLKMIDIDGSFVYSDIINVNRSAINSGFTVYPNPATNYTNLYFNNTASPKTMQLFDANGRLIQQIQIPRGQQIFKLNTADLASGWYGIQLMEDGKIYSIKLIK
jgi:subtilase family serine protease